MTYELGAVMRPVTKLIRKSGVSRFALIAAGGLALSLFASAGSASAQSTCSQAGFGAAEDPDEITTDDFSQTACGSSARTSGGSSATAIGYNAAAAGGTGNTAVGASSDATSFGPGQNTAVGRLSIAKGTDSFNTALGSDTDSSGNSSSNIAIGAGSRANGDSGSRIAIGTISQAGGNNAVAMGYNARATGNFSVAVGAGSNATEDNTFAVGSTANRRRIVNVAAGAIAAGSADAVTGGQLFDTNNRVTNLENRVANGVTRAEMQAADDAILNLSLDYTSDRERVIRSDMATGDARTLADANAYSDTGDAATLTAANTYAEAGDAATLAAANTYADAGDAATLAAATTYADEGDVRTLASANAYADAGDIRTLGAANFYTDQQFTRLETVMNGRFRDVEVRMDQVTAMSAAFAVMAGNNAGAGTGSANRLVVGVGNYGSETAMSVGYSRAISNRTAFNAGVSFTGGEVMSGGSFGFAW